MTTEQTVAEWRIIGETVPGATHIRNRVPNQDAILSVRESSRELPAIIAVSDGHGSPKCFRSDRGSRLAVKIAAFLVGDFLDARRGEFDVAEIESQKDFLASETIARWRAAVAADLEKEPFKPEEFENLEKKSDAKARKLVEDNPFLAYGATLLVVALETDFAVYLQLGDGDILNVSEAGAVTKPLAEDQRLLANETTSLCLPDAAKDFRFVVQQFEHENQPAMILLSTDGYLNSFATETGFFQAAIDIFTMLRGDNGFNVVGENLKAWLAEATKLGSGDDCTVGLIYRAQPAAQTAPATETVAATIQQNAAAPANETASQPENHLKNSNDNQPDEADDVTTVTITIKKDKNSVSAAPAVKVEKAIDKTGAKSNERAANDSPDKNQQ